MVSMLIKMSIRLSKTYVFQNSRKEVYIQNLNWTFTWSEFVYKSNSWPRYSKTTIIVVSSNEISLYFYFLCLDQSYLFLFYFCVINHLDKLNSVINEISSSKVKILFSGNFSPIFLYKNQEFLHWIDLCGHIVIKKKEFKASGWTNFLQMGNHCGSFFFTSFILQMGDRCGLFFFTSWNEILKACLSLMAIVE